MSVEIIVQSRRTNIFADRIITIAASAHAPALGTLTFIRGPSQHIAAPREFGRFSSLIGRLCRSKLPHAVLAVFAAAPCVRFLHGNDVVDAPGPALRGAASFSTSNSARGPA